MNLSLSTLFWALALMFGASGLYAMKYQVQATRVQVELAERELAQERRSLHVLAAEWTYLNRPQRLQELSARYLPNQAVQGTQMADYSNFAYKKSVDLAETPGTIHAGAHTLTLAGGVANVR